MSISTDIKTFFNTLPPNVYQVISEYNKSIHDNIFYINKSILQEDSEYILFSNDKWKMRPYLFTAEVYGESYQYIYPVILTVNNIASIFHFVPNNFSYRVIVKPSLSRIFSVLANAKK